MTKARWDRCIYHQGEHTEDFLQDYLAQTNRRVLLLAGAGFDPRSTIAAKLVAQYVGERARGCFLREERPRPANVLVTQGDENERALCQLIPDCSVTRLNIFAADNAVVGGRKAVRLVRSLNLDGLTDIFIDVSALSIGVAFPVVRYFFDVAQQQGLNLHLLVTEEPETDAEIHSTPTDTADTVHGFKGGWGLDQHSRAARLWMPQLARGKQPILEKIRQRIEPHAVCPILPFPADDPRLPDQLIEHYAEEFENTWQVDARDIVYASQRSPLDIYRTILRMDDSRKRVFAEIGGSQIILSPVGSKTLAVGALMAALDRDFTVMYVESLDYTTDFDQLNTIRDAQTTELVHVWLNGEAYMSLGV